MKIIVTGVSKKIKKQHVLNNITLEFRNGVFYGLYGRNGSGKTMLLRSVAGLLRPSAGKVEIDGKDIYSENKFPPSIGVIIENTSLLPQYDAFTNLKLLSKIKKIATDEDIKSAIRRVGLNPDNKLKVRKFSLGMKQRLSIAQAIFEKPDILLLDEPTNAIDENGVQEVYRIIQEEKERGATIILTSHHKQDLDILADEFIHMDHGEVIHE
ncbi:ABC transporter ATP-binding protein [Terrilactibacillus laevilacticus]|uniref:ABC transporter ATP-binding protein n=1 Tax=Terrilactibacillus laevilacticus TaxID=1380157 RepID=A0ABW5PND2_9BACI|nr:ABC transporter ATP-binding protein [Terrilactibacillus laevilacticus]